jgi:hypothetical protein
MTATVCNPAEPACITQSPLHRGCYSSMGLMQNTLPRLVRQVVSLLRVHMLLLSVYAIPLARSLKL